MCCLIPSQEKVREALAALEAEDSAPGYRGSKGKRQEMSTWRKMYIKYIYIYIYIRYNK